MRSDTLMLYSYQFTNTYGIGDMIQSLIPSCIISRIPWGNEIWYTHALTLLYHVINTYGIDDL